MLHFLNPIQAAELGLKIDRPIHPALGHGGIQLKRSPLHSHPYIITPFRELPFEPSLADIAPRTDDIGIDVDMEFWVRLNHQSHTFSIAFLPDRTHRTIHRPDEVAARTSECIPPGTVVLGDSCRSTAYRASHYSISAPHP